MIPLVVASERGRAQTMHVARHVGVVRPPEAMYEVSRTDWKVRPQRVKAPYAKPVCMQGETLSSAGHVESCVNHPGPSGKAKYSQETDSEPVP